MEQNKDQSGAVIAWMRPDEIDGLLAAAQSDSVARQYGRIYAKQYDPDMVPVCGAAVRGEAVAEFAYKGTDGKFLDSGPWWVENSEINAYMALPILRNGEVIAMVFAEAVDGCREAIEENCRLLCGGANFASPVAESEPTEPRPTLEELRALICEEGKVGNYLGLSIAEKVLKAFSPVSAHAADAPSEPSESYAMWALRQISQLKPGEGGTAVFMAKQVLERAADAHHEPSETYTEPTEIVAYLHQVVSGDGEPDQALSFAPDNFPLRDAPGFRFRSLSHRPLCFADVDHSSKPIDKSRAADALDSQPTVSAVLAELRADLRELANNTETFGEHSQEAARVALDGATDALDEVAAKYASSQPTDGAGADHAT